MRKSLSVIINKCMKKDLELLYGEGSFLEIIEVKKCTTNKKLLVNCKLKLTNIEYFKEIQNIGVEHLISESWDLTGLDKENIVLNLSYELI